VRISYNARWGFVDDLLQAEGIPRKVVASFPHFCGAMPVLVFSDTIATLPTFATND